MTTAAERLKNAVKPAKKPSPILTAEDFCSTGSTLANLACSGRIDGGFPRGHYTLLVGDSRAGKSWLALQTMAEASISKVFKDYRLIHDNPERGVLMDIPRYFGPNLARRLEPPTSRGHSRSLEEFYDNVATCAARGIPFIYALDSEDALQSEAEIKKTAKNRSARRKVAAGGKEEKVAGSYGVDKAKINSAGLREAHNALEATRSILILIKQTRQNINPLTARIKPKTRSGGDALTFYNRQELWFSIREKIRKPVNERMRPIGSLLRIKVEKNCVDGRERSVDLPFYPSVGFDEVGGLVRFLLDEGHWQERKGIVEAPEFGETLHEEALIAYIEDNSLEPELRELVGKVWTQIEAECSVQRKSRYN